MARRARRRGGVRLSKTVAELLTWERVCRVATVNAAGQPHTVPVCHVVDGGKIYFASAKRAPKTRNLRANPRIAVVVDVYTEAWSGLRGVLVQGTARLLEGGPAFRRARARLYAKFAHYQTTYPLDEADSVIVEITPTHVFSWGLE
jgi:PPOX class probable F420-dependent enzyme